MLYQFLEGEGTSMAKPTTVDPVKLFIAILWSESELLEHAMDKIRQVWGEMDFIGKDTLFNVTEYYVLEMGKNQRRRIISFKKLVMPDMIVHAKLRCNEIEDALLKDRKRKVNLDIGYIDHSKIVLASLKFAGQKIYLGQNVYADMIARYKHGEYTYFEWSFPDFKDARYHDELNNIRKNYLKQLRKENASHCKSK